MKLKPFYERLMDGMAAAYYEALTGEKSSVLTACGTYRSLGAPQAKYMFDNDLETYYHSGEGQRTDDFVGVDLGVVRKVREVRIIQGRNSVDDVDYFDHCVLEYSVDGQEWFAMTEPMEGVYDIEWQGEAVEARYVGIRKLESKKRNWLAIRSFEINPVAESEYGWDANPFTFVDPHEAVVATVAEGATTAQLLLGKLSEGAYVELLDGERNSVKRIELSQPNTKLDIPTGVAYLAIRNEGGVYEVVFK
jgi:hyaluronoglucosaminidase